MDDLFESYAQDYAQIAAGVKAKLAEGGEAKVSKGEARKTVLRRINMELEEADEIIAQMEIELQSQPKDVKTKRQIQIRGYKSDMGRWKNDVKSLMASADRDELFSRSSPMGPERSDTTSPPIDGMDAQSAQRARLLRGTDILSEGQRRLNDSHRIALETEDLGAGILRDLNAQRGQLENTRDTLGRADSSIDKASGTLKQMIRRMYQQRVVTILIIIVLLFLIALVLYSKLR
ncbi:V-snare-domain-containing protein [Atractiella rhizophila]|nr:V-snare-domain-containing protein [Atractiella rhizophila]